MYYVGNYEKEMIAGGNTNEYDYICTPEGLTAIAVKTNGTRSFYYVQTDQLGSVRVVTNASKGIQTRYYYDAWGKQTLVSGTSVTNRGYTGEEHLNDFGLINLNARLYDPALGRFLAMDPYVTMPDYTQGYNRYSYAMNNPLRYTDPSGEFSWFPFGLYALFAYLYNSHDNTPKGKNPGNPGNWSWNPGNWSSSFVVNVGYNTGGNWTFSGGVGNPYSPMPMLGYNTQYGAGVGMNYNGSSSMYYPGYENKVNSAIEQNANKAISQARDEWAFNPAYLTTSLTATDTYSSLFHNHTTYITTRGKIANIYRPNGEVNSARAANFARTSRFLKGIGVASSTVMAYQGFHDITTGDAVGWDYTDAAVGSVGAISGALSLARLLTIPGVGEFVAGYSWFRLWFELGAQYGPSTWYGTDDNKWFK